MSGRTDLNEHRPLGDAVYDDVLTGLKYDDRLLATALSRPSFQVSLTDQKAGREIVIATDTLFREFVVFAPDHRAVVALEPYTCATDALNLAARGIDAGLRVLRPNWPWRGGHMVIEPAT